MAAAIGAAAILSLRALLGPVQIGPIAVWSPLSLEGFIAAVFVLLILFGATRPPAGPIAERPARILPLILVLIAVAFLFFWNLRDPFLSDDYILVNRIQFDRASFARQFSVAGGDGSFRPIGYVYRFSVAQWAGLAPWKWHLSALILHLVNCTLLYFLVNMLWRNEAISWNAALLFGIHGTRPEVVTWSAGNFDALACCFSLAALICAFRARRDRHSASFIALFAGFLILAVWSKESAYATPFLLIGFAWAAGDLRRPAIWRSLACAVLVCGALLAYRWMLFGGPGGYQDRATGRPAIFAVSALGSAKALLVRLWAILLFPINWDAGSGFALFVCAGMACAIFLFLAWNARRDSRRTYAALLAATAGALLPALPLALIGSSELGSRIFYLPSIGFCTAGALLATASSSATRRVVSQTVLSLSMALALAHNLHVWHQNAMLADQICSSAAASDAQPETLKAPSVLNGVVLFANGLAECVSMKRRSAEPVR